MNFTSSKKFGEMAREIAAHFNNCDFIKAASTMPYSTEEYFTKSRSALTEIYLSIKTHFKTVRMIVDDYIINDDIDEFISNQELFDNDRDEDIYMQFVRNDVGQVFTDLHNLRLDLVALKVIAHPEDYSQEMQAFSMNDIIIERINDSEPNIRMWNYCCEQLKNRASSKTKEGENATEGEPTKEEPTKEEAKNVQNDVLNPDEPTQSKEVNDVFEISNVDLVIEIYKYIISTEVISKDFKLQQFISAIEQASINCIPIEKKKKGISILKPLKDYCIGRNKREWYRRACSSVNVPTSRVTSNNSNLKEWYEDLQKIVSKYSK